jgi:hypothetical protein
VSALALHRDPPFRQRHSGAGQRLDSEALIELGVKGLGPVLAVRADSTDIPAEGVEVTIGAEPNPS